MKPVTTFLPHQDGEDISRARWVVTTFLPHQDGEDISRARWVVTTFEEPR
jgi:hypothetical protein